MTRTRGVFVGAAAIALVALLLAIWNAFDRAPQPIAPKEHDAVRTPSTVDAAVATAGSPIAEPSRTEAVAEPQSLPDEYDLDPCSRGELEVRVFRHATPLAGVRVRLWEGAAIRGDEFRPNAAPVAELRTDAEGKARFTGLGGESYRVRADDGDEHVVRGTASAPPWRPLLLVFGNASVAGIVVDAGGRPLAGIAIGTTRIGHDGGGTAAHTTTGPDGRFLLRGLRAGRRYVFAERLVPFVGDQNLVELDEGERAEVVLGGEVAPLARWSGTFADGEGQPIPGPRRLIARNVATRDERDVAIGSDGRFDALLPVGSWEIYELEGLFLGVTLSTIELTVAGLQSDLVWPGCRIVLTLVVDNGAAIDFATAASQLYLTGPVRSMNAHPEGPLESPAGQYLQWLVPVGGRYRLVTGGGVRLPGDVPVAIEVASAARVHRQTVYVR